MPTSTANAASSRDDIEASGARPRSPTAAETSELEVTLRTRAEVLTAAASSDPDLVRQAAQAYCALGRLYAESQRARDAIDAFRHASELDPSSIEAIRGARVLYTKARRYQKALRMLLAEQERTEDAAQRLELHRDEAVLRRRLADLSGSSHALRLALRLDADDMGLVEELAHSIQERVRLGHPVEAAEREEAASLFEALARSLRAKPADPARAAADTLAPPSRARPSEPQAEQSSDWLPESDWPRESPASLGSDDRAAIEQLRQVPSEPAGPLSVRAPSTTLLPPPGGESEAVPVFELRTQQGREAASAATPVPASAAVRVGLEASAPPRSGESQRPQGDALIGRLFEALHTLEFLNDAQSGAEFVMRLVMETLEVEIGIVHLYDINARSFVVASAGGPKADALIELRSPESEPMLAAVMAGGKPLLLAEAHDHPLTANGRWALLDCAKAILAAPAQQDGRFLGAIEVANPVDGSPFTDDDLNAMTYVAERFTNFLVARGIVLSADTDEDVSAAE